MLIDCDTCTARGLACDSCVVPALLGAPAFVEMDEPELSAPWPVGGDERMAPWPLDEGERRALRTLADSGLVPSTPFVALYEESPGRAA